LEGQLGAHQDQIDSLDYRVDVDITPRLETAEEQIEGLLLGRVSIDVSYHELEARQLGHQELIDQLRGELPGIRDRAQATQETQWEHVDQLALLRERLTVMERRDVSTQLRVQHLEEIMVAMDREIRRLRGEPGPSGASGGA
jgi:chromosome segregation ATPase